MRKGRSRGDKAAVAPPPPPPPRREPGRAVAASAAERRATLLGGGGRKEPEDARAAGPLEREMITESTPLRCRKLSNPDIFSSAGKTKLHRQLSQDDCKLRRGSLASSLSGKQLLPLSNSVHSGVGQTIWQPPGDTSNLVRMRNQSLGQSAPSLTAGLKELSLPRRGSFSKPLMLGRNIKYHQHNDETEETEARSPISADPVRTVVRNKLHLGISN